VNVSSLQRIFLFGGKMKLYEINNQLENIIENNVSETGEISTEIEKQIETLELQRKDKIQALALLYKDFNYFSDSIANEINFIKAYLERNLAEGEKFNETNFTITWRKSTSIEVDPFINEKKFAEQFPDLVNIKIELQKNKIKDLIKTTGVIPDGITYVEKNNLVIK
jgi:vacuolar-type H+-ATPase subunit I/STV1